MSIGVGATQDPIDRLSADRESKARHGISPFLAGFILNGESLAPGMTIPDGRVAPGDTRSSSAPGLGLVELLEPSRVDGGDPTGLLQVGRHKLRLVSERGLAAGLQLRQPLIVRH